MDILRNPKLSTKQCILDYQPRSPLSMYYAPKQLYPWRHYLCYCVHLMMVGVLLVCLDVSGVFRDLTELTEKLVNLDFLAYLDLREIWGILVSQAHRYYTTNACSLLNCPHSQPCLYFLSCFMCLPSSSFLPAGILSLEICYLLPLSPILPFCFPLLQFSFQSSPNGSQSALWLFLWTKFPDSILSAHQMLPTLIQYMLKIIFLLILVSPCRLLCLKVRSLSQKILSFHAL